MLRLMVWLGEWESRSSKCFLFLFPSFPFFAFLSFPGFASLASSTFGLQDGRKLTCANVLDSDFEFWNFTYRMPVGSKDVPRVRLEFEVV